MAFPASMTTQDVGLQHLQNFIHYQKTAVESLRANLATYPLMERQPLPLRSGKVMQFYMVNQMAVSTVPATEGTPGPPLKGSTVKGTVTIQQFADYMTFSDLLDETSFSPVIKEHARELGYRAARGVDVMNYAQWDAAAAASAAARIDLPASPAPEFMSASVARRAVASLQAANVMPKENGLYGGVMHPLVSFDYMNDNVAGGVLDILKYNDYPKLKKGVVDYQIITLDGIRWISSTEVPTTANYLSGGATAYHSYVIGRGAFFAVSLGFTNVPGERNFTAPVTYYKKGSQLVDPAGLIAASAAYNYKYGTYTPGQTLDSVPRFRRIRSEVSIV